MLLMRTLSEFSGGVLGFLKYHETQHCLHMMRGACCANVTIK